MKFAYSTNAYTRWPLAKAIADVRAGGFDGVEILADAPHAFQPSPRDVEALKAVVSGFPISNLNANTSAGFGRGDWWPSLLAGDPQKADYVGQVVDLAVALGAPCVCTATGEIPPGMGAADARRHLLESLDAILARSGGRVRIGLEYEPGFFLGDAESTLAILREVDHPMLGVNLDLGHAACVGEDPSRTIDAFAGRIWNIHLEDIKGRVHEHLVPGRGDMDMRSILTALDRIGYDRFVTLELYPYKDAPGEAGREGLAFLKSLQS